MRHGTYCIGNRTTTNALDGHTYYDMLYDVKMDLACVRCAVCHHRTEREIVETRVDCELGYQASAGRMSCTYLDVAWASWPIVAEVLDF